MATSTTHEQERLTYTIPEAARLLGLSKSTAYRAVDSGDLPVVRVRGRLLVPRARLMEMLEQNTKEKLMSEEIDPTVAEAVDERTDLINRLTALARKGDWKALRDGIQVQDQDQHAAIIFMLILQRANDQDGLAEMLAKLN